MKNWIKKSLSVVTVLACMAVAPLAAQVFLQKQKSDISPRANKTGNGQEWIIVPVQGMDIDQYNFTPAGSGVVVLSLLCGVYVIAKKKK